MKLANHNIHALAKKLFHHNQGAQRAKLMHPERDWLVGLLVGMVIIIIMISWSAYTYIEKRDAIGMNDTGVEAEIPLYKSDTVEDALTIFDQRAETFAQLNQSTAPVPVPEVDLSESVVSTTTGSTIDVEGEEQAADVAEEEGVSQAADPESAPQDSASEAPEDTETPVLVN